MSKSIQQVTYETAQECISQFPVIILGSGASAAYGIPDMPKLKDHLLQDANTHGLMPEYKKRWEGFLAKLRTKDLETVLSDIRLPDTLTNRVVEKTWDFIAPQDYKVFKQAIANHNLFPLTKLFQHLFSSARTKIHVITSNYDRIAEYAADCGGLAHYTGFNYGHIRTRTTSGTPQISIGNKQVRTVNIWKVHGSLDWFLDNDGIVVGLPVSETRPTDVLPAIVTPGIEKYRLTHDEPFHSIKSEADKALKHANSYLCVGYGFNESHLQTVLTERCREGNVPLVLITKTVSKSAKKFLQSGQCERYLAIEECGNDSKAYCNEFPSGEKMPNEPIWQLEKFLNLVMS